MVQTLRGKTPGVGKVPNLNTRIDTFENRQNLTDKLLNQLGWPQGQIPARFFKLILFYTIYVNFKISKK